MIKKRNSPAGFTPLEKTVRERNSLTGFTLTELLIAISLVGMIILSLVAVDVAMRKFLNTSDYTARVQNEISPALDMIVKDTSRAIGYINDSGIVISGSNRIEIRQLDTNNPPSYSDYADDPWIRYSFNNYTIEKRTRVNESSAWTNPETIARNISSCNFTYSPNTPVGISITALHNAALTEDENTNPRVTLETSILPRSSSTN